MNETTGQKDFADMSPDEKRVALWTLETQRYQMEDERKRYKEESRATTNCAEYFDAMRTMGETIRELKTKARRLVTGKAK